MTLTDFLIIYLACGAPFGVYYFLQNRTHTEPALFWFKTLFNFLFWIPGAFIFFRRQNNSRQSAKHLAEHQTQNLNILSIGKNLEKEFLKQPLKISIYEFREIFERYVGLTLAVRLDAPTTTEAEKEIYRLTQTSNVELAAICLNRRNRKRLVRHQTEAREDFINLINKLSEANSDNALIKSCLFNLTDFLEDYEARKKLELRISDSMQIVKRLNVKNTEKDLWKPEIHKPSTDRQISYR